MSQTQMEPWDWIFQFLLIAKEFTEFTSCPVRSHPHQTLTGLGKREPSSSSSHTLSLSRSHPFFFLHQCPKIPLKPISGINFTYSKLIILWWIGIGRRWGRQGEDQRGGQWKEQRNLSRVLGGRAKLSLSPQSLCHSPASSLSSLSVCSHFLPVPFFSSSRSVYPSAVAQFVKCP